MAIEYAEKHKAVSVLNEEMPPTTEGDVGGIELGLVSHVEASVEVLASPFGSPCVKSLFRR